MDGLGAGAFGPAFAALVALAALILLEAVAPRIGLARLLGLRRWGRDLVLALLFVGLAIAFAAVSAQQEAWPDWLGGRFYDQTPTFEAALGFTGGQILEAVLFDVLEIFEIAVYPLDYAVSAERLHPFCGALVGFKALFSIGFVALLARMVFAQPAPPEPGARGPMLSLGFVAFSALATAFGVMTAGTIVGVIMQERYGVFSLIAAAMGLGFGAPMFFRGLTGLVRLARAQEGEMPISRVQALLLPLLLSVGFVLLLTAASRLGFAGWLLGEGGLKRNPFIGPSVDPAAGVAFLQVGNVVLFDALSTCAPRLFGLSDFSLLGGGLFVAFRLALSFCLIAIFAKVAGEVAARLVDGRSAAGAGRDRWRARRFIAMTLLCIAALPAFVGLTWAVEGGFTLTVPLGEGAGFVLDKQSLVGISIAVGSVFSLIAFIDIRTLRRGVLVFFSGDTSDYSLFGWIGAGLGTLALLLAYGPLGLFLTPVFALLYFGLWMDLVVGDDDQTRAGRARERQRQEMRERFPEPAKNFPPSGGLPRRRRDR